MFLVTITLTLKIDNGMRLQCFDCISNSVRRLLRPTTVTSKSVFGWRWKFTKGLLSRLT